tara:strand:+ start:106 stop:528 length:423 start_codon:yes stop_codon:yes gene_type:complete
LERNTNLRELMAIKIPKNLMKNARKNRVSDGKVNTTDEMVIASEEALWEKNPVEALKYEKIETRKKLNWWARFTLSMIIVMTFLFLIWLLFYGELPTASRDLINIMVGAYVAVLAKATDYWFKDKDDPEQKETADINQGT